MISRTRVSGILGTIIVLQVVGLLTNLEEWTLIRRIDKATQSNSQTLSEHSDKLANHEQNFQQILEGTFSPEFANKVRKYLPNEQTK